MKKTITLATGNEAILQLSQTERLVAVQHIGEYTIVETTGTEWGGFSPWVGDMQTSHVFDSLDAALVFAIAYKHDGINTRAHNYFLRGIGVDV